MNIIKGIKNSFRHLSLADIIIISLILLTAVFPFIFRKDSRIATIYKDNITYAEVYLNKDKIISIDSLATIETKNGKVRFSHSTCKNQICVKQGWSQGKTLICVPNKIYVEFGGDREEVLITY